MQQLERLRRQVDVLTGAEQAALGTVQRELAESKHRKLLHKPAAGLPPSFRQRSVSVASRRRRSRSR